MVIFDHEDNMIVKITFGYSIETEQYFAYHSLVNIISEY